MTQTENKVFINELTGLINKHSRENGSNTPDYILAEYLERCLLLFDETISKRTYWYGEKLNKDRK